MDKTTYDLTGLGKKARYDVRQGLGKCQIQQISFQELAQQGWRLQADTLDRQGRGTSMTFGAWKRLCLAAQDLQGFEAWGAMINGRLGAAAITARIEDWCYILYQQSHREYLPAKINNALTFVLTKEMLARPEISHIHYGLHSLDAPASVDEFKFRMGYLQAGAPAGGISSLVAAFGQQSQPWDNQKKPNIQTRSSHPGQGRRHDAFLP